MHTDSSSFFSSAASRLSFTLSRSSSLVTLHCHYTSTRIASSTLTTPLRSIRTKLDPILESQSVNVRLGSFSRGSPSRRYRTISISLAGSLTGGDSLLLLQVPEASSSSAASFALHLENPCNRPEAILEPLVYFPLHLSPPSPAFPSTHFCPSPTAHFTHALSHLVLNCPPSLPFFLLHSITFVFLPSLPLAAILIAAAARHCICIALTTRTYREPCPSSSPPSSPPSYSSSSSRATSESRRVSLLVPPSPLLPLFPSSASRPDDPRL